MVASGTYTAKLIVGNKIMTQNFEILLDISAKEEGINKEIIQKQHEMQTKIMALLSEARLFQDQLENEIKDLKKAKRKRV